ncbi:MAG TPA: alpha/beta hydrolase [Drouetiella sp.]
MSDLELIFLHGWALNASTWSQFHPVVAAFGSSLFTGERGYFFDAPKSPSFTGGASKNVLVTHSLGLHMASEEQLKQADLLVIIGGFMHFHDGDERQAKISRIIVRKMLQKLQQEPERVLEDFYVNCGFPAKFLSSFKHLHGFDQELLKNDLELLNESSLDPEKLALPGEVIILQGNMDTIAPPHHAERILKNCRSGKILIHPYGNHALPYEHPEWCLEQINRESVVKRR